MTILRLLRLVILAATAYQCLASDSYAQSNATPRCWIFAIIVQTSNSTGHGAVDVVSKNGELPSREELIAISLPWVQKKHANAQRSDISPLALSEVRCAEAVK